MASKTEAFLLGLTPDETATAAREALDMLENDKAVEVAVQWAVDAKMVEEMIGELEDAETEAPESDEGEDEAEEDEPA